MAALSVNQFLSGADTVLSSAGSIDTGLRRVARAVVPRLADFCLIFLVNAAELECRASAHVTREGERLLRELNRVYKITRTDPLSTVAQVVRTGRAKLRGDITAETEVSQPDLRVLTLHRRLGVRSALVVPIGSAPRVLGAISLSHSESGRHYTPHDLSVARRLAAVIASALRHRARVPPASEPMALGTRRFVRLRARI
jgi:GAF domain-containing protein